MRPMKLSEFDFHLPEHLIAQHPPKNRGESRLLVCKQNTDLLDEQFPNILNHLQESDVLVMNDTKVLKARLFGQKASGGRIEVMLERMLDDTRFTAMIRASKSPKPGSDVLLPGNTRARVLSKTDMMFELQVFESDFSLPELLEQHGQLPLPPYITHTADQQDNERYQTVFAREPGAVAAPTAGLHFTEPLLDALRNKGVQLLNLTLHVGAGTFLPVKTDNVDEHVMHSERYRIDGTVIEAISRAKSKGGRVVAVGTTSLRALEAFASETSLDLNTPKGQNGSLALKDSGHQGDTQIFIKPGHAFKVVDCLITNFHLPKSTLLMLVSAFAGKERIMQAYQHAIERKYRFFSYGDAMWLERA